MVLALVGDSTMIKLFAIASVCVSHYVIESLSHGVIEGAGD